MLEQVRPIRSVDMIVEGYSKYGLEWFSQSLLIDSPCCIAASLSKLLNLTTGLMVLGISNYLPWRRGQRQSRIYSSQLPGW